jgi:hypothetical protein
MAVDRFGKSLAQRRAGRRAPACHRIDLGLLPWMGECAMPARRAHVWLLARD